MRERKEEDVDKAEGEEQEGLEEQEEWEEQEEADDEGGGVKGGYVSLKSHVPIRF